MQVTGWQWGAVRVTAANHARLQPIANPHGALCGGAHGTWKRQLKTSDWADMGWAGKAIEAHCAHLRVHGILRGQGHDHQTNERDALGMEALALLLGVRGYTDPCAACRRTPPAAGGIRRG